MQVSIYNSLFGALTQEYRLDITANNLANVNTTGYKQEELAFRDVFKRYAHDLLDPNMSVKGCVRSPEPNIICEPRIGKTGTDFDQGSLKRTGNPLDLAIQGEGFFRIRTPEGNFYSRNGAFHLSSDGRIVTAQGYELLAGGQAVQVPPNSNIKVNSGGDILADGEQVAQIDVVSFEDLSALNKRGENLFQLAEDAQVQEILPQGTTIEQGALESSNVQLVQEMVNMIDTMRSTQSYQKVMTATKKEDSKVINEVGRAI